MSKYKKTILYALFIVGIGISAYLTYAKLTNNPLVCGLNAQCSVVQASEYASLFGIPLGIWGMVYYFSLFAAFFYESLKKYRKMLILWGLVFSIYLTGIEAFILNAYCTWCLGSFFNIVLINLLHFFVNESE